MEDRIKVKELVKGVLVLSMAITVGVGHFTNYPMGLAQMIVIVPLVCYSALIYAEGRNLSAVSFLAIGLALFIDGLEELFIHSTIINNFATFLALMSLILVFLSVRQTL